MFPPHADTPLRVRDPINPTRSLLLLSLLEGFSKFVLPASNILAATRKPDWHLLNVFFMFRSPVLKEVVRACRIESFCSNTFATAVRAIDQLDGCVQRLAVTIEIISELKLQLAVVTPAGYHPL